MAGVDEVLESPLPHVYDLKSGQNFLIDTMEPKFLFLNQRYKITVIQLLIANFLLLIATYGNKSMILKFHPDKKFRWKFVVADVVHNILGIDFIKHFGLSLDFGSNTLLNSDNELPVVAKTTEKHSL